MQTISNIIVKIGEKAEDQWTNIPNEVKELYMRSTEELYSNGMNVENIHQKEANIYNSLFGQYGLSKPIIN